MARQDSAPGRLSLLWRIVRHPLVWVSLGVHGLLLAAPMPHLSAPPAEEEVVEEAPEEEVSIDILAFAPEPVAPQSQQSQPQSNPQPAAQPAAPTEENLERQQEVSDQDLENSSDDDQGDDSSENDGQNGDGRDEGGDSYQYGGNCNETSSGNFALTREPFWPGSVADALRSIGQLKLFFKPSSIESGAFQETDNIVCLKLIARDEQTFANTALAENAAQANLTLGQPDSYGGQTLHQMLNTQGEPVVLITTIPLPPAKVLVLTWGVDPRTL